MEQLQTIEKEAYALELTQKEFIDTRDHLDQKKIERTELEMKYQASFVPPYLSSVKLMSFVFLSVCKSSYQTLKKNWNAHNNTPKISGLPVNRRLSDCNASMKKWFSTAVTMKSR